MVSLVQDPADLVGSRGEPGVKRQVSNQAVVVVQDPGEGTGVVTGILGDDRARLLLGLCLR